jgi:hypothetical protein
MQPPLNLEPDQSVTKSSSSSTAEQVPDEAGERTESETRRINPTKDRLAKTNFSEWEKERATAIAIPEEQKESSCNFDESNELVGNSDDNNLSVGEECHYPYPSRVPPPNGYLSGVDYFFYRDMHADLQQCYMWCIDANLNDDEDSITKNNRFIEYVRLGLNHVVRHMLEEYPDDLDPLHSTASMHAPLNAIQEAIHGGYADMVKILTKGDYDTVIDIFGRTVKDYIQMKGSPIRPKIAKEVLGLDVDDSAFVATVEASRRKLLDDGHEDADQWNSTTGFDYDDICEIDVLYGDMALRRSIVTIS